MSLTPPGPPPGPPPSSPPPSGPPAPPTGWVVVTLQGNPMSSNFIAPKVRLNGFPMPASYGQNVYALPPGSWRIDVHCQWARSFGQAAMDVLVQPGQTVPVFYAAPWHQFTTGSIGHVKQPRKGLLGFALILTVLALFVGLMVALIA